ncbi:MAG TPA: acyl-CoA dehydrogenase family protein [Candidatus Acidoferrum sp.]|nr:acyl-CoA dehydrogenase family protein [Candidatus Acidoferrum sp.]
MDFRLTPQQELFKKTIRGFCEEKISPRSREIDERGEIIPDDIIKEMVELGIFGVTIPEEYEGSSSPGEELVYATLAVHEVARAELSMSLPVYTLLNLGWSYLVVRHGSEELKKELLPKVASGQWFIGIATTESGGGSDLSNIKTTGKKTSDGYAINGEKTYISGVTEATRRGGGHLTLFRTAPELGAKGMTFAYVPAKSPGISTTLFKDMGRMGLSTGGFTYKDAKIPTKYVLGDENRGFYVNMEGFNVARVLVASACLGGAEKCLELGADYVKRRVLFGKPLAKFEGISFEIAEDFTELEMTKNLLLKGAWMIDQHYKDGSFANKEINQTIAMCKLRAPLLAVEIVKHSMMYHGALGYSKEAPMEMCMRGLMSYVVGAEGGANIMKIIIARELMGDVAVPYR